MRAHLSMKCRPNAVLLATLVIAALLPGSLVAQPFNCLPSCADDDARFLAIAAGAGFITLSDPTLDLTFIVSAGSATFDIGIFDGDYFGTSGVSALPHWDLGTPGSAVFEYTLFADPNADVSGTVAVLGPISASSLSDNAWDDFTINTGPEAQTANGDYVYRLRVELMNPDTASAANVFKVRTSSTAALEPIAQPFGYIANITGATTDIPIVFPNCAGNFPGCIGDPATITTSTYDGDFTFFVEAEAEQSEASVWDGDFDRGDANGVTNQDTDDLNTPMSPFEPIFSTIDTVPEGVAVGIGGSTGSPPDDTTAFLRLRAPSIRYELRGPAGKVYANDNPSGNQEWEEFKIVTTGNPLDPADCSSPDATRDCTTGSLPAGAYELAIQGVDMANLNFVLTPFRILCVDENGDSCQPPSGRLTFEIGDTVFEDFDGDGLQGPGEPGIQGVVVNLLAAAGNVIDTTVTDSNGNYAFMVFPDTYAVEVAPENFVPSAAVGAIGDTVWYDVNGDGLEGAAEPGISNVSLQLFLDGGDGLTDGADDTLVATTKTDQDGHYFFNGLGDGDYWVAVVDFTLPSGLALSGGTDPSAIVAIAGTVDDTVDFGYENGDATTAVVGNYVWIDADGNGMQDAGEAGIANVTLDLIDVGGDGALGGGDDTVVDEARTGFDGSYLFTGVGAGTYVVDVTDTAGILSGAGLVLTTTGIGSADEDSDPDPTATFTVVADDMILSKDFGYVNTLLADVTDTVWFDANRNGLLDGSEVGIAGVTVNLVDARGEVIASTITDGVGEFTFADLPDGTYGLLITDQGGALTGLLPTTEASASGLQDVTLAGADVFGVNFGWVDTGALEDMLGTTDDGDGDVDRHTDTVVDADIPDYDFGYRGNSSIGDRVWEDANGDTSQAGEGGINGVTVELLRDGVVILTDVTSGDGNYLFDNLRPGDYTVRVVPPVGFNQTFDLDLTLDNETDVTLGAGDDRRDVDFGYQAQAFEASLGDRVWNDINGDGVQDPGEAGINDVTVRIFDSGGGLVGTDVTSGDGDYSFDGLVPDTYTVVVDSTTLPEGFVQTFDIEGPLDHEATVVLGSGDDLTDVDFGYADECLTEIDFERDASGAALHAGQIIDDEWAALGVTVTTSNPGSHPAMIFDSSNPTGGDHDLGTPNETFGGPGIGSGGESGEAGENAASLGKVLIISEDGDTSDPDDDASGGTVIFDFAYPVRVDSVGILDIDEGLAGTVTAFDGSGGMIGMAAMANSLGNNSVQRVALGASGVRSLEIYFPGSGAVTDIVFCADCTPVRVRDNFSWESFSNNDGPDDWSGDWIENDPEPGGAGPSAGQVQVHGGLLTLDDYPNTGGEPSAAREVDLSGAASASLSFKFLTSSDVDPSDAVTVEISNDGGGTWSTLEVLTDIYGAVQETRDYDISAFISSETQVRFRVSNKYGGYNELFCVTWIEIETGCDGCQATTVIDDFVAESFANNDGPDDWTGDWIENDPEKNGAGPWDGQVRVASGYLKLDDYPNTGGYPSAARQVDLSGAVTATLSFDFRTTSGVDTSDAVAVEVSSDGGASWTTLETITGIDGSTTGWRTFDISAHASAETQIRFRVSSYYGGSNETFKVDWVKVESDCGGGTLATVR